MDKKPSPPPPLGSGTKLPSIQRSSRSNSGNSTSSQSSRISRSPSDHGGAGYTRSTEVSQASSLPPLNITAASHMGTAPGTVPSTDTEKVYKKKPTMLDYRRESDQDFGAIPSKQSKQSVDCQTEWSWLEDMKMLEDAGKSRPGSSKLSPRAGGAKRRKKGTKIIVTDDTDSDDEASTLSASMEELHRVGIESASSVTPDKKSPSQLATPIDTKVIESVTSTPFPQKDDEYGIPTLAMDTEDEMSDSDSDADQYKYKGLEDGTLPTIPSVGPPKIIEYQRESQKPEEDNTDELLRLAREEAERIRETGDSDKENGVCEFCGSTIKKIPTLEEQRTKPPEELYCCTDYQEFLKYTLDHPMVEALAPKSGKIDVKAHAPHGSSAARKEAKQRAGMRMREREMAKLAMGVSSQRSDPMTKDGRGSYFQSDSPHSTQKGGKGGKGGGGGGGGPGGRGTRGGNESAGVGYNATALSQIARQMKTINYMLSSQKCLEEGWTVRPPSPLATGEDIPEVFEPEPVDPGVRITRNEVIEKFYPDGRKFVLMFRDGTGNVFYPSGRIAISIVGLDAGQFQYIAQDDHDDVGNPNILASFSTAGHGSTFFHSTGQTRLHIDPVYGVELDPRGIRRRKWLWRDQVQHVHAPPLQPITMGLNYNMAVRIQRQEAISLTFTAYQRSARFQLGARLKLVNPKYYPDPQLDYDELYRTEMQNQVESLFAKVANLLRFPHSPKLERLPEPKHITTRAHKMERIKEEAAELAEKSAARRKNACAPIVSVN